MTRRLRALIVEDEPIAVRRMMMALRTIEDVEVVGSAGDGAEALLMIRRLEPDIVFLDISLPEMSGIELADRLNGPNAPSIVFVTAYDQFAVRAFELAAADYLLKPVEFERVAEAVDRVRARQAGSRAGERVRDLERRLEDQASASWDGADFWVNTRRGHARLEETDIERLEAERDYVRVYARSGEYLIQGPIQAVEDRLDPRRFLRVHRSHVVNLSAITGLDRRTGRGLELMLASGVRVPVGRSYTGTVRNLVGARRAPQRPRVERKA
jgi:DNA-binding LytR/AlgR family response regulator